MAIPLNPNRVKFKEQLVADAKNKVEELGAGATFDTQAYDQEIKKISSHINTSRDYLTRLRSKCYALIDSQLNNALCLADIAKHANIDPSILHNQPSVFLQKAYTEQTFHTDQENINRDQPYINLGKKFAQFCEEPSKILTTEQTLFNDVGTVIAAINNAISQMNRTENTIKNITLGSDVDTYLSVFMNIEPINRFIELLTVEVASQKPTILNSNNGILANAYDDLMAIMEKFVTILNQFFRARYQSIASSEQSADRAEASPTSNKNI